MRKNYKIFGIARNLYRIGSACVNFVVGQALEPMSQPASNELDTENTQAYKNGIFGITSSGNMPQSVQEDVVSHLDCKYEDLIKNAGIFVPKTTFEDGETGYDKNAVVYTQNNDNTITLYISQVDNNKSIDLTDTNYWVKEATIPGIIDGSKLTLNNLSDTAKENIKNVINLDYSDFSLLKTSLDDIIPTNNKELNGMIEKKDKNGKRAYRICRCDCGNICEVQYRHLVSGHTQSCGCIESFGEECVKQILEDKKISYIRQYKIKDCKDKNFLPFDFAIFINNKMALIEVQGKQHYNSNLLFWSEDLVLHDKIKQEFCKERNISFLILDYSKGRQKNTKTVFEKQISNFIKEVENE